MNTKKIVNIINFARAEDPRIEQKVLFDIFKKQVELCKSYYMPNTY